MQVSTTIYWQSVTWPGTTAATDYAIFVNGAIPAAYTTTNGAIEATVSYDDAQAGVVFVIRPTDGNGNYGPSQSVVIANQPLNNRAWIRNYIRKAISDRIDTANTTTPTLTDDEINEYINDAIRNYSLQFPLEKDITITLLSGGQQAGARDYNLPSDCQKVTQVRYSRADTHLQMYLKEEAFKGGETTATSWIGYPKLGILQSPMGGRYYPGHYYVYEGALHIDFDPLGNGDNLYVLYQADYQYPVDDVTPLAIPTQDIEMLTLYIQGKCWMEIESKDVRLSRWDRGTQGTARRDDMPTEKMSTRMFNAWNTWVKERRTMRPRQYRLARR